MYEGSKSNGNTVVMTKNTCFFRLDRVWNIHVETTENSISRFLDFNIFWGSKLPQETATGSRLWRWQYFPLLRNIRISTNTPSQTPATRLASVNVPTFKLISWQKIWCSELLLSCSIVVELLKLLKRSSVLLTVIKRRKAFKFY